MSSLLSIINVRVRYIYILAFDPRFSHLPPLLPLSEIRDTDFFPRESSTFQDGRGTKGAKTRNVRDPAQFPCRKREARRGCAARPTHGHTYIHRRPSILGEFTKALVARLIVTGLVSISRTYVARVQLDVG